MTHFSDFPLPQSLIDTLTVQGLTTLTAVQKQVIPSALKGNNVFFESETGTGKTLAFLLPLLTRYIYKTEKHSMQQILILSPTIELASQIKETVMSLQTSGNYVYKSLLCIGGSSLKRQIEGLKEKPAMVIGTPARITELISLKKLKMQNICAIVIDEADRQLSQESSAILQTVLASREPEVQILACSATFNKKKRIQLTQLLSKKEKKFQVEYICVPRIHILQTSIEHWALFSETKNKTNTLRALIHILKDAKILIFTAPAHEVETLTQKLKYKKIDAEPLYGKLEGADRKQTIARFRSGKTRILVTSDLSARGLDIPDIDYIIQMNTVKDTDVFIHRAGRTGRAGKKGINIVIGDEYELLLLQRIEKKLSIVIQPKIVFAGKIEKPSNDY